MLLLLLCLVTAEAVVPVKKIHHEVASSETAGIIHANAHCKEDVEMLCPTFKPEDFQDDYKVLECLQNNERTVETLNNECHHIVWTFMRDIAQDKRFPEGVKDICRKDLQKECESHKGGEFVSCMLEYKHKVKDETCRVVLIRLSSYMFSDYRLISSMINDCEKSILDGRCGRIADKYTKESDNHSQGAVLECLMQMEVSSEEKLGAKCKRQILRLAELQSDDFHQDRPLYFACREARELFCSKIRAGEGRVYRCLEEHKFDRGMPEECTEKLTLRQQLFEDDAKVDIKFATACLPEVKKHCMDLIKEAESLDKDQHTLQLYAILHCLGEAEAEQRNIISRTCKAELHFARKQLLSDYQITAKIVHDCKSDITTKCDGLQRNGQTIHCLMAQAIRSKNKDFSQGLSEECFEAVSELMSAAHALEDDIDVDPVLGEVCQDLFDKHCQHKVQTNRHGIDCLLELLPTAEMIEHPKCEAALLEVEYFAARDFEINIEMYHACKSDAKKHCNVKTEGGGKNNKLVMPCLYRQLNAGKLASSCAREMKHVMRLRSVSIDMQPEIEEACIQDLGRLCSKTDSKPGAELNCLEEHYAVLQKKCQDVVKQFVEIVEKDPKIDEILMQACLPYAKKFCGDELHTSKGNAPELIDCMIRHKSETNQLCQLGIERYQLLSLNDWHFSQMFAQECGRTIIKLCKNKINKAEVIRCLSDKLVSDVLSDKEPSAYEVPHNCRRQLKAELMVREEKMSLDPDLQSACASDLKRKCGDVEDEAGAKLECLRDLGKELSSQCFQAVFRREKLEALDPRIDMQLRRSCKAMIIKYCSDVPAEELMDCLVENKDEHDFNTRCHKVVVKRLRIENQDVHLKPALFKACLTDIKKLCQHIDADDSGVEGKVLECLRDRFLKDSSDLSSRCEREMQLMVRESVKDVQQDPVLSEACMGELRDFCSPSILNIPPGEEDDGKIEECLRGRLIANQIKSDKCKMEVARVLLAGRADIHIDPALAKVCSTELESYCSNIPLGQGRKMTCLLNVLHKSKAGSLTRPCEKMLNERNNMWAYARKIVPAQNMGEIWNHITQSPSSSWFFFIATVILICLLVVGIFFGRVSRRIAIDMKSK